MQSLHIVWISMQIWCKKRRELSCLWLYHSALVCHPMKLSLRSIAVRSAGVCTCVSFCKNDNVELRWLLRLKVYYILLVSSWQIIHKWWPFMSKLFFKANCLGSRNSQEDISQLTAGWRIDEHFKVFPDTTEIFCWEIQAGIKGSVRTRRWPWIITIIVRHQYRTLIFHQLST